jgi:hypothetical protein
VGIGCRHSRCPLEFGTQRTHKVFYKGYLQLQSKQHAPKACCGGQYTHSVRICQVFQKIPVASLTGVVCFP